MNHRRMLEAWRLVLSTCCSLVLLVSCGGGVDSGGTGGATALAAGPVTGLGSIIVNGVRFDDSNATIMDQNDQPLSVDQLQVGMLTRIDAAAVQDALGQPSGTALSIRVNKEIVGPIDSIGPLGASMVVLGLPVRITAATWLDNALAAGLASLAPGQVVDVYGQYNARTNEYVATRLVPHAAPPSSYQLRGLLSANDPVAKTLVVSGLTISYASLAASDLPALTVGRFLIVTLGTTPAGSVWNAVALAPGNRAVPDRSDVRVAGRISAWQSATQFSVDGVAVDATNAAFPLGQAAIVLGARVAVNGSASAGVLSATKVLFLGDETLANSTFEFHGSITALDTTAQTFVLRGVTVHYGGQVTYVGGTAGSLSVGQAVVVTGTLTTNRTGVDALTISFN